MDGADGRERQLVPGSTGWADRPRMTAGERSAATFFQWLAAHEAHFRNRRSMRRRGGAVPAEHDRLLPIRRGPRPRAGRRPAQAAEYLQEPVLRAARGRFLFDFVHEEDSRPGHDGEVPRPADPQRAPISTTRPRRLIATTRPAGDRSWRPSRRRATTSGATRGPSRRWPTCSGATPTAAVTAGPAANSYMRLERAHPVVERLAPARRCCPAPRIASPSAPARGTARLDGRARLSRVPPEMVFPARRERTSRRRCSARTARSRVAYFPGDVDRTFWRRATPISGSSLGATVRVAAGRRASARSPSRATGSWRPSRGRPEPGHAPAHPELHGPNMTRAVRARASTRSGRCGSASRRPRDDRKARRGRCGRAAALPFTQ